MCEESFEQRQQQERAYNERSEEDQSVGGRQEEEGERAADEKGREDGEGIRRGFFEQASEACLGMGFKKATPEGEGASCGGVGEEERDD